MTSKERVRLLQLKLYLKAKQESGYKFYILYDKIFQKHILSEAYKRSKTKNGFPGVDKQTFADVEKYGREKFLTEIRDKLKEGKQTVYDADLSKYFDTMPHKKLEIALKERIAGPRILHLIKLWLKVPIVEENGKYTGGKSNTKGTPQGGVISPLLANIYMNLLDRIINNPYVNSGIRPANTLR
ncbi:MAG: hypothetical protein JEY97_12580 [Bacteroidales bacterium]|nr:hypothetical protein [Bacteroidales bacterium]